VSAPDEQQVTEVEARVARARLEALREEMARRPPAQPREDGSRGRTAAGASFSAGMLVLFVVVILVGLYVLKLASKALQLG
jgi:hypothetical protein